MPEYKREILHRCAWCNPKHLMDTKGRRLPGPADSHAFRYSDGVCVEAEARINAELDARERKQNDKD